MGVETARSQECCPVVDPTVWDDKVYVWDRKPFIKDSVRQLFHMPLPWEVGRTMTRMWQTAQAAQAAPEQNDFLILAHDPSPWKSEFLMAVTKEIPGTENVQLSGTFMTKVYDGPYSAVPKWLEDMNRHLAGKGKSAKKHFFYFTTCPKCAKLHGHNYVVAFAQVE